MFVLYQPQYNKSGIMSALADIMREKKAIDSAICRYFEWVDKSGQRRSAYHNKITRGQALSYLWASARKLIERNDKRIDDILDNYVEARKKQMKEENDKKYEQSAREIIKNVVTIDDLKKVVKDLKISAKAWWRLATEANIDDKVKRYGYGRLA